MIETENERITLTCIDLTSTGEGLCDFNGYKIFVDGVLPGEVVECKILRKKKNYAIGQLLKIVEPSKERVDPICPHFSVCGGCQIMHLEYNAQLSLKKNRVEQIFRKIANIEDVLIHDVLSSQPPLSYRNKIQMPAVKSKNGLTIGLYEKRSHNIIDIEHCFLHNEQGQKVYNDIRRILESSKLTYYNEENRRGELRHILIRTSRHQEKCLVMLIGSKDSSEEMKKVCSQIQEIKDVETVVHGVNTSLANHVLPQKTKVLGGSGYLTEKLLGITCRLSALSFFQVNISGAEKMYELALSYGQVEEGMHVIDAYSGVGVFSCLLAKKGAKVTAIEVIQEAIDDTILNAKENGVKVKTRCGKVEDVIKQLVKAEVIYLNPPRKGCDQIVLEEICKIQPKRIIYTSCDPATLARDAKYLFEKGYTKIEVSLLDMFPQTMHVESVTLFQKDCELER